MAAVTKRDIGIILGRKSFNRKIENFNIRPLSEDKVVGFLGDHFILQVATDDKNFEFFLKTVPRSNIKRLEFIEATGFFRRECVIYEHFIPKIAKYSSFKWSPKCFLVKNGDFIVLQYLKDFRMVESKELTMDYDHYKVNS